MGIKFKHQQYFISDPLDLKCAHESELSWISHYPVDMSESLVFPSTNSLDITCFGCVSRDSVLYMMHIAGRVAMFLFVYECCVHACMHACVRPTLPAALSAHCYCSFLSSSTSSFAIFFLSSHPIFTPLCF